MKDTPCCAGSCEVMRRSSRIFACHWKEIKEWKMRTARSSAATISQIHRVHGESSNRVARRVEDASKAAIEQPALTSAAD